MSTFYANYPASAGGSSANASVGVNGVTAPTSSTEVGGINPSGNLQPFHTDASGNLLVSLAAEPGAPIDVNIVHAEFAATTGAAVPVATVQVGGIDPTGNIAPIAVDFGGSISASVDLATIQGNAADTNKGITTDGTLRVVLSSDTSPIPGASTASLQTTGNTSLSSINTKIPALGQSVMATSTPVAIASNQSAIPVSGTIAVTGVATAANQTAVIGSSTGGTAATNSELAGGVYDSTPPTLTNTQQAALQLDVNGSLKSAISGLNGASVTIRPDNELRVATDASSLFYDTFDSSLDTTNKWTTSGTAPTVSAGVLTVSPSTTALAVSALTSQATFPILGNMFNQSLAILTLDSGLKTGNYRFFGQGILQASPTVSAPLTNAVGFEWSDVDGVLRGVVWSAGSKTQTVSLSTVQPTDGANHRYQVYFKSSRAYFEIDNVVQASIAYPNPGISVLPIVYLSVNGASTVSPAAVFNSSFAGVGDSAANNKTISDPTFPWRKASVSSTGSLTVSDSQMVDLVMTGQAAQTATVNNILPATSSATATTVDQYRSASVQIVSTGTAGTFIFEGSNDNVNFQTIPVYSQLILTGTPIVAAITASAASSLVYIFPVTMNFIRVRIATTITGGSIQAFSRFSPIAWIPPVLQVAQGTAANLATTATVASGTITTVTTVGSVTSSNTSIPGTVVDVASAAIITTTTTATITPTFGSSYMVDIPVTVVSGTLPTMVVQVQESPDSGTNWYTVYTFPLINATGSYTSPVIVLTGNRVRYVQTITGTTPSFTRAINRLQSSQSGYIVPSGTIYTDRSGSTSGTPSTSTQVAAANNQRRYLIIQNLSSSATIYINFTSAATAGSGSLPLLPFAAYAMESSTISTEAINVLSATASVPFTCKEG